MAKYSRAAVAAVFFFPALGGLLFGYDIGSTSYVVVQLAKREASGVAWSSVVASNAVVQGLITSGGVAGALVGAAVVFRVADRLGRRREILVGAACYLAGAVLQFLAGAFQGAAVGPSPWRSGLDQLFDTGGD